jgi:hypothetical protein
VEFGKEPVLKTPTFFLRKKKVAKKNETENKGIKLSFSLAAFFFAKESGNLKVFWPPFYKKAGP